MPLRKRERFERTDVPGGGPYRNVIGAVVCVVALAAAACFVGYCYATLPDMASAYMTRPPKITLTASDGSEIASYGSRYGKPVVLTELPPHVYQAVIAIEDRRFYSHHGVDPRSVLRALLTNLIRKRKAQGASTITQQVAKNLFLTNEKTFTRKVRELLLSFKLERLLTKDQILTIYLNRVYLGAGTYGINAAARKYYGIDAKDLNLYQSAVIAGLLKAPTRYNPLAHPEASNKRARIVLATMAQAGFISARKGLNAAEEVVERAVVINVVVPFGQGVPHILRSRFGVDELVRLVGGAAGHGVAVGRGYAVVVEPGRFDGVLNVHVEIDEVEHRFEHGGAYPHAARGAERCEGLAVLKQHGGIQRVECPFAGLQMIDM